jgi:hypothetical protein
MKAGTAQKIVLNLFSTLLMIRLGRVYRGLMVHMRATNAKLRHRAAEMVDMITGCGMEAAARASRSRSRRRQAGGAAGQRAPMPRSPKRCSAIIAAICGSPSSSSAPARRALPWPHPGRRRERSLSRTWLAASA